MKNSAFLAFSAIDASKLRRYSTGTSLLSVSTAERGADSSETALAFFMGWFCEKDAAS
jgi:hypothetical protein